MIAVVLFAMIFAAALALLLARYATDPAVIRAEEAGRAPAADRRPRMPPALLRTLVLELLGTLGLEVIEEEAVGSQRRLVAIQRAAVLGGSRYVVFVVPSPPGDLVDQEMILELAENVKSERGAVGLLITPYAIDTAGLGGLEVPLELIDGARLRSLLASHLPRRLPEVERHRGFAGTLPRESGALEPRPA